jgi:hypothetical protein
MTTSAFGTFAGVVPVSFTTALIGTLLRTQFSGATNNLQSSLSVTGRYFWEDEADITETWSTVAKPTETWTTITKPTETWTDNLPFQEAA